MLKGRRKHKHKNNEYYMNINSVAEANERKQKEMKQDFTRRLSDKLEEADARSSTKLI
jgi:hypothetical protein